MRTNHLVAAHLTLWSAVPCLLAQPAPDAGRVFCDAADPGNRDCPGPRCVCAPDTLEITFDGKQGSTLEYTTFVPDAPIEATVVLDTKSPVVQGWSYGVEHDAAFLTLESVAFKGTDAELEFSAGLLILEMRNVETCGDDPGCQNPRPGTGFVSAVLLGIQFGELKPQRNSLAFATYALHADPGESSTHVRFVEHLRQRGSPTAPISIVNNGGSLKPSRIVDGTVRQIVGDDGGRFRRGDTDGNGRWSVLDAVAIIHAWLGAVPPPLDCDDALDADDNGRRSVLDAIPVLQYVFQRGPGLPAPFPDCGVDPTTGDLLSCVEAGCP